MNQYMDSASRFVFVIACFSFIFLGIVFASVFGLDAFWKWVMMLLLFSAGIYCVGTAVKGK